MAAGLSWFICTSDGVPGRPVGWGGPGLGPGGQTCSGSGWFPAAVNPQQGPPSTADPAHPQVWRVRYHAVYIQVDAGTSDGSAVTVTTSDDRPCSGG